MSRRLFVKYEGAGNDFLLVDDRKQTFPDSDRAWIRRLCHRRFGLGADGLILLRLSSLADFQMILFNADGSDAPTSGNGLRCLTRFLFDLGMAPRIYRIATAGQIAEVEWLGSEARIKMAAPTSIKPTIKIGEWLVHSACAGTPHAVVFVADVDAIDLFEVAKGLRHHPYFGPGGINVNVAAKQPDGSLSIRTFERGVEGETLACGTGAICAVAAAGSQGKVKCKFPGGVLEVDMQKEGVWLTGPANRVFEAYV